MVLCEFCNKEYKNEYTLKAHKNRPSCLKNKKIKETPAIVVNECEYCFKVFSEKYVLTRHLKKCKGLNADLEQSKENLSKLNKEKDAIILELKKEVKELKNALKNKDNQISLLQRAVEAKHTTVYNDNSKKIEVNVYLNGGKPPNLDELVKKIENYTQDHFLRKGEGIADWYIENALADCPIICTDISRCNVRYVGDDGGVVVDSGANKLFQTACKTLEGPSKDRMKDWTERRQYDLSNSTDFKELRDTVNISKQISLGAQGKKVPMRKEFASTLCSKVPSVRNLK